MAQINHKPVVSLYEEAKAGFISLIQQTASVFIGFVVMLLITGGTPSSFVVAASVCLATAFVAWSEQRRVKRLGVANPKDESVAECSEPSFRISQDYANIQQLQKLKYRVPLELHYLGDPVLRKPAERISKVDAEIRLLAKHMLQIMNNSHCIGLAAPQVGVHKQLIVVDRGLESLSTAPLVMINPSIIQYSKKQCRSMEGCSSIPHMRVYVVRPESVQVLYEDEYGCPQKLTAEGLLARNIQHNIDHLNGILFVDRVDHSRDPETETQLVESAEESSSYRF